MFFDKGRVYETMSRTGIEKTRDIGDIERQKRNRGMKGKKVGESGRIETQLHQSTAGLNATPRLCVTGATVYFFASEEAEPNLSQPSRWTSGTPSQSDLQAHRTNIALA